MKRTGLILIMLGTFALQAQTFKTTPTGNTAETTLVIKNLFSDLVIEGVTGGELIIETDEYEGIPDKAKGLKPLSAEGPENTGIKCDARGEQHCSVGCQSRGQ